MQRRVIKDDPLNASTPFAALRDDITPTPLHYVRSHFPVPKLAAADVGWWRLEVGGLVNAPLSLSLADIKALPTKTLTVTIECAGNGRSQMRPKPPGVPWDHGAVSTATWKGASLRSVLERAGVSAGAVEAVFTGADVGDKRFERSLPLEVALHPDTLLAWEMNGAPLAPDHGYPVRIIVPGWYGMAGVKWVRRIDLTDTPFDGYYQTNHYTFDGEQPDGQVPRQASKMRVRALILSPLEGDAPKRDVPTSIDGRAWSGEGEITRVDVSTDGGKSYHEAKVEPRQSPYVWQRFTLAWTPETVGPHVLIARATDAAGNAQPLEPRWNSHGYGNNAVLPVKVEVE